MKRILGLLSLSLVLILSSCGPTAEEAAEYNDKIIAEQSAIVVKIDKLDESFQYYIPADMDAAYNEAINQISKSVEAVTALDKFDGKTDFKDEALVLFSSYKTILESEYKEMVRIYKIPDEQFTEDNYAQWDKLDEASKRKLDEALTKFSAVQEEFAKKYNLTLY